jgi:hypothetical protein
MLEVADVLRRYGQAYLDTHGAAVPQRHRRAIRALIACRTAQLGGHLYECDRCGHQRYAYHSCRNRHCPKCHGKDVEAWLTQRVEELLPVPYFHVVFTLPQALRRIVRQHQHVLYPVLMRAAAHALQKLAMDPRYVGGRIGILAVLHTWSRTLEYHPHVHCLVPGGGLDGNGHWVPAREDYLVPVRALSRLFRGIFMARAKHALPDQRWPTSLWNQEWVVYAKPTAKRPDAVLAYLGRYVHRIAISNSRILSMDDARVTFRYYRVGHPQPRTMTLVAPEFIRRFLQHVLPDGFHKVRYYGLWAPAYRKHLHRLGEDLSKHETVEPSEPTESSLTDRHDHGQESADRCETPRCPQCHEGRLQWVARIPPGSRDPPHA